MPRIRLVKPTLAHESAIRAYLDAVHAAGLPLHGAVLEQFPDVASWIAFCDAPGGTLMPNGVAKVADSTYPACWNQGYATEMLALALQKCDALGLRELLLTCSPDNPASRRVIEKNGGVLENIVEFQGNPVCHYRIRRGA